VQVKRSGDSEHTRLIRIWVVDTITPFERVLVWAQDSATNLWHNYFYLRGVRAENRQLNRRSTKCAWSRCGCAKMPGRRTVCSSCWPFETSSSPRRCPRKSSDPAAAIFRDHLYRQGWERRHQARFRGHHRERHRGQGAGSFSRVSQVLLINDQTSGVGAMLEKSRLQGVLKGTPDGEVVLQRVMSDEKVVPGDTVISSGGDRIFPKGLPVGTVSKVSAGREMFLNIQVKPAADLSRLEEVLVVTAKQAEDAVSDSGTRVRAADILAQRLPSVPDKPAVPAPVPGAAVTSKPAAPGLSINVGAKPLTAAATLSMCQKKSVPKAASGDVVSNTISPIATGSKTAGSPTTPQMAQPKPLVSQPTAQPPAAEDDPH